MQIGILAPDLRSIEQLFTGDTRYAVPKYQRSFAWGADEIEELWEDLMAAIAREGEYFLGTMVLHRRQAGLLEIIDGQQRLASITMIFSAIRNVFLASRDARAEQIELSFLGAKDFSRDSALTPKLVLNYTNNESFVQHVLESRDLQTVEAVLRDKSLHPSNRLLLQAYRFFLSRVTSEAAAKGTQADDFLVPLIDTLRSQVKLITIPVTSEEDANLFFESLNARGKELAISDLVKNRLYLETGDQVTRAQQLWEQMENELGRQPIPEYLRHYWIAKKADAKTVNVREKQLYRMIAQDIGGKKPNALRLLEDLRTSASDYSRISDYDLWPDDPAFDDAFADSLSDLRLFRVTQCNPLLLNAIQKFANSADIARTFRIVANFSFRYFIVGNQSPGNLERVSAGIAREIRTGTYASPNHVADALRAVSPDPAFRSDFSYATFPKSRGKIARYALAKLSNHLARRAKKGGGDLVVSPDARQVNLEHILPQDVPEPWRSNFPKGEDPETYVRRIGNLTLLNAKVNREVADASFAEKKRTALDVSAVPLNFYFRTINQWGPQQVDERQDNLAKTAIEVWKL
jgi:uncharacterized protein with ParB-like and HNH nuclease domain